MSLTKEEVARLEKVSGQMDGLHKEISALSRKSPNDGVNKFKLKFVNSVIADANDLLGDKYRPLDGFEQFDEDDVPTNSDVAFVCGQYIEELERKRSDNITQSGGLWIYNLTKSSERVRTAPPRKLEKK